MYTVHCVQLYKERITSHRIAHTDRHTKRLSPSSRLSFNLMWMEDECFPCPSLNRSNGSFCDCSRFVHCEHGFLRISFVILESVIALHWRFALNNVTFSHSITSQPANEWFQLICNHLTTFSIVFLSHLMYCPFVRAFCFIVQSVGNKFSCCSICLCSSWLSFVSFLFSLSLFVSVFLARISKIDAKYTIHSHRHWQIFLFTVTR